ncbi:CRISPR-associated helicase Cas3' [Amorphus sp. 3PC139-8]|uniref:CRISPR-associated helicase Cas3' n=1 Tax=Amorphus sp. 3PC139-8 TaxID=2735676 RepID=UPI00345D4CBF
MTSGISSAGGMVRFPWGKLDRAGSGEFHHLAHHMADVAACVEVLCRLPVIRRRLESAAGQPLSETLLARLAVLAFLHDIGKLHPGFQAIGWPKWPRGVARHGHQREGLAIVCDPRVRPIRDALPWAELSTWTDQLGLLVCIFSHHGRPTELEDAAGVGWSAVSCATVFYDPVGAAREIGQILPDWFPDAFVEGGEPLPATPAFQHLFCGLLTLADWIGSDRRIFEFVGTFDPSYMARAREKAEEAVRTLRLDVGSLVERVAGHADFTSLTGFTEPKAHQALVGAHPLDERLLILEAETGSGKTEAALWRFVRLFEAGLVDSLYFALPTRAAAAQLQHRVQKAAERVFGDLAPEVVLAVPGYVRAGTHEGLALPGFEVRWDDDSEGDERTWLARWAAESAKRYLAAPIAVGTVDQAMLAALAVKHAHLRAASLSRSLLVIDECHSSDGYQVEVQTHLLKMHLGWGGHAFLMSATLGSKARVKWLGAGLKGRPKPPSFEEAIAAPYPALWSRSQPNPASLGETCREDDQKSVAVDLVPTMAAEEAAGIAIAAAEHGARVLLIRNTVDAAVATFEAVMEAGGSALLLQVAGGPALHHGRFSAEDRRLLDGAVEAALSPERTAIEGRIVIGTQTLEQSLDVCSDFLLTDLCPVDVLLQRIGRLHRRREVPRPDSFATPRCRVMQPEAGLAPLLAPAFENGLGAWATKAGPQGIYMDLAVLELTRRLVVERPVWTIPADNRFLVESATHTDRIDGLHGELGAEWAGYRDTVVGKQIAEVGAAKAVVLQLKHGFQDDRVRFPGDEERIRTRLGEEGARVTFAEPVVGPFGAAIEGVTLPAHWSRGLDTTEPVTPESDGEGALSFEIEGRSLHYDRRGLRKAS